MNKEKFQQVRDRIARIDDRFSDMGHWVKGMMLGERAPECGTSACIAGHTIALEYGKFQDDGTYDPYDEAKRILGLTSNQASLLFYSSRWQPKYKALIGQGHKVAMVQMLDDVISGELVLASLEL